METKIIYKMSAARRLKASRNKQNGGLPIISQDKERVVTVKSNSKNFYSMNSKSFYC